MICRICGLQASLLSAGREIKAHPLFRCSVCETVMVNEKPDAVSIAKIYNDLFSIGDYEMHRIELEKLKAGKRLPDFYRTLLLRHAEHILPGRSLIEIGGGSGRFGLLARLRGWNYVNWDISEVAVDFCKQLGLPANVFEFGMPPPLASESADAVAMWEVLEHVWTVSDYLSTVRKALKPGGVFIFSTPNFKYEPRSWGPLASPPIHINFFTADSLTRSLRLRGFEDVKIFKNRVVKPELSLRSIASAVRCACFLEEPTTLFGSARRKSSDQMHRGA